MGNSTSSALSRSKQAQKLVGKGEVDALKQLIRVYREEGHAAADHQFLDKLLYMAVEENQYAIAELLLKSGAVVGQSPDALTVLLPLHCAASRGHERMVRLLLTHGADVDAADFMGQTPLFNTKSTQVADLLLKAGADIYREDERGFTVLDNYLPMKPGGIRNPWPPPPKWDVLEVLLGHENNINSVDKNGESVMHHAAQGVTTVSTLKKLIALGGEPTCRNNFGQTPLHRAAVANSDGFLLWEYAKKAKFLLNIFADKDIHAEDQSGDQAFHVALRATIGITESALESYRWVDLTQTKLDCLRHFCAHGCKWDTKCDEIFVPMSAITYDWQCSNDIILALRVCIDHWTAEHKRKHAALTAIPVEIVNEGSEETKTYLNQLFQSDKVILRRKICVVGPSCWGKTSLIKSLTSGTSTLVDAADRTIGVDSFTLSFQEELPGGVSVAHHQVTFSDFAGQDEYQVAHSLFYSSRTLYLVCIDLNVYAIYYRKMRPMQEFQTMMNAFVETHILRWNRSILARQIDATFHFIGTKFDLIDEAEDGPAMADLKARLANVMVIISNIKHGARTPADAILYLEHKALATMRWKPVVDLTDASCTEADSVKAARKKIEALICENHCSYAMPESYMQVLDFVKRRREAAATVSPGQRIEACLVNADKLIAELIREVNKTLGRDQRVDGATCRSILRALRDTGDILWYEEIEDPKLQATVILDPLVVMDLVREIFSPNQRTDTATKNEAMWHANLMEFKFWGAFKEDEEQLLAMKRMLWHFHLAHPTTGAMKHDSDLLVSANWQSKPPARSRFPMQRLTEAGGRLPGEWLFDIHWEIRIYSGFETALFDLLVVASYDTNYDREVGPDYISYGDPTGANPSYACWLVVEWNRTTQERALHLEAVLAKGETDPRALWRPFEILCEALAKVYGMYPGLKRPDCSAHGPNGIRPQLETCTATDDDSQVAWKPPKETLDKCRKLLTTLGEDPTCARRKLHSPP